MEMPQGNWVALKSFVCLNLMVLLSIFSSISFLTLCNSYGCGKCIYHHLFPWVCPFCAGSPYKAFICCLLCLYHYMSHSTKPKCWLLLYLSSNMRLDTANTEAKGSFLEAEPDSGWILVKRLQQCCALQ